MAPPSHILDDDAVVLVEKQPTERPPIIIPPKSSIIQNMNRTPSYNPPVKIGHNHNNNGSRIGHVGAYIVGGGYAEEKMFRDHAGFDTTRAKSLADLFVFTGGEDINPKVYGETPHSTVHHWTDSRDKFEIDFYKDLPADVLKVGICRGGQLLNILNGGHMVQHTDGHHGNHLLRLRDGSMLMSNSVHHQQMLAGPDSEVLACANISTLRYVNGVWLKRENKDFEPWSEAEIIWYPKTNSLCIQGHPEYSDAPKGFKDLCWDLIETYYWDLYGNAFVQKANAVAIVPPSKASLS